MAELVFSDDITRDEKIRILAMQIVASTGANPVTNYRTVDQAVSYIKTGSIRPVR